MGHFANAMTRRRASWAILLLALLLTGLLLGAVKAAERTPTPLDSLASDSDSAAAAQLLEQLPREEGSTAVVVLAKDQGRWTKAELTAATKAVHGLPLPAAGPLVPSRDGTAALAVIPIDATGATQVAHAVAQIRSGLGSGLPAGVTAQVTGPAAVQADLAAVFEGANLRLLAATASIVAILLVVTYRSPTLWIIPLLVVGIADQVAAVAATRTLAAFDVTWDESTVGILSVLVFGAGTDYALLLISRYRDELRRYEDRHDAMAAALRRTAEAVLASAATVVVGLLTLLLSLFPATRGLGLACAVGVVVAAAFVLVVLPAALVNIGRWVFRPRIPRVGEASIADSRSTWRRVGDAVARRPVAFVVGSLVILALGAAGIARIELGLSDSDQFIRKPEAIAGAERLAQSFPAGTADPTRIATTAAQDSVLKAATAVPGVASARPGPSAGGVSRIDVVLADPPSSPQARATIERLRVDLPPGTHVGGSEAVALDASQATTRDRELILPIVLGLVLAALVLLLRCLVAPLVLIATVVASYAASLGLGWWVSTSVFGFARLDDGAPLLAFVFLVALGVDYNIFLVTRAREEARGHGPREGMLRGLAATGGVITSAGILLAAVFAVLGVLPLVVLAQIGIIICIGVLLDTLLVRTVLVPAIALLLGDRFWWPRRVDAGGAAAGGAEAAGGSVGLAAGAAGAGSGGAAAAGGSAGGGAAGGSAGGGSAGAGAAGGSAAVGQPGRHRRGADPEGAPTG